MIEFLEDDGTFSKVEVKKVYEVPRDVTYPLVTIQEIENTENTRYSTDEGEQVTNLSYQIDCYCKTTQLSDGTFLNASDSAKLLGVIVSKLLGGENYKLARVGNSPMVSVNQDNTVMRYIQRFTGCLFKDTIYRR